MDNLEITFRTDYSYLDNGGYRADPVGSPNDIFHIQNNAHNMAVDQMWRNVLEARYTLQDESHQPPAALSDPRAQ